MIRGVLGLAILALEILAIIDCAQQNMAGGKKALWILLILFLPGLGLILYYLVGRNNA